MNLKRNKNWKRVHQAGLSKLDELTKNSILIESEPNHKANDKKWIYRYYHFYVPVKVGNKLFTACIVCEEWGEPKKYKPIIKPLDVKLYDLIIEKRQTLYKQHMEGQPPMAVSK